MRIIFNSLCVVSVFALLAATNGCAAPYDRYIRNNHVPAASAGVKYAKGVSKLGYAIQIGAFSDVKNAERLAASLQIKGIEAFYFRKDNGIYAVRFGDFPTKNRARAVADRLVSEGMIDGYYIANPNENVFGAPKPPVAGKPSPDTRISDYRPAPSRAGTDNNELGLPLEEPERVKPSAVSNRREKDIGNVAARTAERFVGIPYQWGGETVVDGMDCSGFVRAVYNLCGINIPRTSREQYKAGNPVDKSELRDGDLLFFGTSASSINHVGIYVGNGKFVHAPKRGEDIKTTSLDEAYFERRFVGARRYVQ